ncbi:MAG: hypothetical protein KQH63_18470 [Desulfobulbaceae bacterium]|nr:hypothetical protein [Desulfobulbaceae bacterium]
MIIKIFTNNNDGGDDVFCAGLNTDDASSYDYLSFLDDFVSICMKDRSALEFDAKKKNRTINHDFKGIGSIPKNPE